VLGLQDDSAALAVLADDVCGLVSLPADLPCVPAVPEKQVA
jgi:hypothetical protein